MFTVMGTCFAGLRHLLFHKTAKPPHPETVLDERLQKVHDHRRTIQAILVERDAIYQEFGTDHRGLSWEQELQRINDRLKPNWNKMDQAIHSLWAVEDLWIKSYMAAHDVDREAAWDVLHVNLKNYTQNVGRCV